MFLSVEGLAFSPSAQLPVELQQCLWLGEPISCGATTGAFCHASTPFGLYVSWRSRGTATDQHAPEIA
jgi:hypothetical protein